VAPRAGISALRSMRSVEMPHSASSIWSWPGRSIGSAAAWQDLVGFLSELHALRIDLFLNQQGLDTTTPAGKAMFQMMGMFAEFGASRHHHLLHQ
jgi:hypothetical protein